MSANDDNEFGPDPEKIARRLDAFEQPLTADEAKVAQEVKIAEAWLAGRLDVRVPDAVLLRVGARTSEQLARQARMHGRMRWRILPAGAVAAAAVVMAAVVLALILRSPGGGKAGPLGLSVEEIVTAYLPGEETPLDARLATLSDEVSGMLAESSVGEDPAADQRPDAPDANIERFWQDLSPADEVDG
jgi:hypothetical protein